MTPLLPFPGIAGVPLRSLERHANGLPSNNPPEIQSRSAYPYQFSRRPGNRRGPFLQTSSRTQQLPLQQQPIFKRFTAAIRDEVDRPFKN